MMPEPRWSLARSLARSVFRGRKDGRVHGFPFFLLFSVARGHISLPLDAFDDFGRKRILEVTRARERATPSSLHRGCRADPSIHPKLSSEAQSAFMEESRLSIAPMTLERYAITRRGIDVVPLAYRVIVTTRRNLRAAGRHRAFE